MISPKDQAFFVEKHKKPTMKPYSDSPPGCPGFSIFSKARHLWLETSRKKLGRVCL
jgi:hypothetical protein